MAITRSYCFSTSFRCFTSVESSTRQSRFTSVAFTRPSLITVSSHLNSSRSSGNGDLQYDFKTKQKPTGTEVFVKLPMDVIGSAPVQVRKPKTMEHSFRALVVAGVAGVVFEVWWGIVEKDSPRVYNWKGYKELLAIAKRCGLMVRVVLAFHQCGSGPGDPHWVPLPSWVIGEMSNNPDIAYSNRFGRRNIEYISLGCDTLPVLRGRSPVQVYADFMKSFRDTFSHLFGHVISGIQVGMGPAGELRYPSCPSRKLTWSWNARELGEFQCYDKYMLAALSAHAQDVGKPEWGDGGPFGARDLMENPEKTDFFRNNGSWNSPYGRFFLEWYSTMLLLHGERICLEARSIFQNAQVHLSAKVAGIHWHYGTESHASELTAGYYNTSFRDGYLPIVRLFARHGFTLCCTGFEMQDVNERKTNPSSRPETFLRQLLLAARFCHISLEGENFAPTLDDESFQQVVRMSKFFLESEEERPSFSFIFGRMDKTMFDSKNWVRFTRFVKELSRTNSFRAKLDFSGSRVGNG